jgi:hypothetical protein
MIAIYSKLYLIELKNIAKTISSINQERRKKIGKRHHTTQDVLF